MGLQVLVGCLACLAHRLLSAWASGPSWPRMGESRVWETFGDEPVSGSPMGLLKLRHVKVAHPVFTAPPTHPRGWRNRSPGCRLTQPGHATGEGPLGAGSDWQAASVSSRRPPAAPRSLHPAGRTRKPEQLHC